MFVSDPLSDNQRAAQEFPNPPEPIGHSILAKCFLDNHPVIVNDCEKTDLIPSRFVEAFELRSCIAIPLVGRSKPVGVLRLDDTEHKDRFQVDDLGFYAMLGNTIGTAVSNAELYTRIKRTEEELRKLNEELEARVLQRTEELEKTNEELMMEVETRKRAEAEVRTLSLQDPMTGLNNRRGFFTLAEHLMRNARRTGRPISLLYIDLDDLKIINDDLGHAAGDEALLALTALLNKTFRETDIIARMGGDEFVVASAHESAEYALIMCERLCLAMEEWNASAQRPFQLSATVGLIQAEVTEGTSLDELLVQADKEMYLRKKTGR